VNIGGFPALMQDWRAAQTPSARVNFPNSLKGAVPFLPTPGARTKMDVLVDSKGLFHILDSRHRRPVQELVVGKIKAVKVSVLWRHRHERASGTKSGAGLPPGTYSSPVLVSRVKDVQSHPPVMGIPGRFFQVDPTSGEVPTGP
jgi:hypothetical protein